MHDWSRVAVLSITGLTLLLLPACTNDRPPDSPRSASGEPGTSTRRPGSPTAAGDQPTVEEVAELSGITLPDEVSGATASRLSGELFDTFRLTFTMPADEIDEVCVAAGLGPSLLRIQPFDDGERASLDLPDDAVAEGARSCQGMLAGTNVSRELVFVPIDADTTSVHTLAFEMPR